MLNEIIRTNQKTFGKIASGTHATETYNDNNMYCVELDTPIEVGASGSGLEVVSNVLRMCGLRVLTTAPTADNISGDYKVVVLNAAPATRYNGYIYMISPTLTAPLTMMAMDIPDEPETDSETETETEGE